METLNFENGVAELDLATLNRTVEYELAKGGLPKSRPIEHAKLLTQTEELLKDKHGLQVEWDPIVVAERQCMKVMWKESMGVCPVENFLVQRLVSRVHILDGGNKELNVAIAIAYNEHGIQLAWGTNVKKCSNQMIFGENLMSTYGGFSMPFEKMWELFGDWTDRLEEKKNNDYQIIAGLQKKKVSEKDVYAILGKLIYYAERSNISKSNGESLNVTQTLRMIDNYEMERKRKKQLTAWDICNFGTAALKPKTNDMVAVLRTNQKFNNFLIKELELKHN